MPDQSAPLTAAATRPINGLIMLIEFEHMLGLRNWEAACEARGLTTLIQAQSNVLTAHRADFARLAAKGHVVAGLYAEAPLWDAPFAEQTARMREVKAAVEDITQRPMRLFGSRYFACDTTTLRAADALGIEFVLARGTTAECATVYAPHETRTRIVSVSNVPFNEMGTGSLCDYSLWARGSTDADFASVLDGVFARRPSDLILVSHAYLGGTKQQWWRIYQAALARPDVAWRGFDEWLAAATPRAMPLAAIPVNREVKYGAPRPAQPLERMENVAGIDVAAPKPAGDLICQ